MIADDPVSPLVLRAKSRAQETLQQDGIDCIVTGARWLAISSLIFILSISSGVVSVLGSPPKPSWAMPMVFFVALLPVAFFDFFTKEWLIELLRRKFTYSRVGYVSVQQPENVFKNAPRYARPLIWMASIANGLYLFVLLFNVKWGLLFMIVGPALLQSIRYDLNRWPRHILLLAASIFCALNFASPKLLLAGIGTIAFIFLADGLLILGKFLRSTPVAANPRS